MDINEIYKSARVVFMGTELLVAPGALVPREETELLGETAVEIIGSLGVSAPRVIDMCCGTGNLACGIARRIPDAELWASDLTDRCIELARCNVLQLGLADRVRICQGDLFGGLRGLGLEGTIDAVICNPPYLSGKLLDRRAELLAHEPREAFDGGPYGLSIHQRVIREASAFLRPGGVLLLEIGLGQHRQVELLFRRAVAYEDVRFVVNAAGEPRVVRARVKAV
jgi:release factor glutamine methyltransferase